MNSESERSLSLEKLRQRNMPPPVLHTLPPPEQHPNAEEWDALLEMLSVIYRVTEAQYDILSQQRAHPLQSQMEKLTQDVSAMRETVQAMRQDIQQAGKRKERRFSLPHIRLPRPSWAWLMVPMILVGLAALWYGSVTILRALGM